MFDIEEIGKAIDIALEPAPWETELKLKAKELALKVLAERNEKETRAEQEYQDYVTRQNERTEALNECARGLHAIAEAIAKG